MIAQNNTTNLQQALPTVLDNKYRYVLIHGIGEQHPDWYTHALNEFPLELQPYVVPFYWADILNKGGMSQATRVVYRLMVSALSYYSSSNLHRTPQPSYSWQLLVARLVTPLLERWLDFAGDLLSYASVRYQAFDRLHTLVQHIEAEGQGVILIGHSLGSVLAFEFCSLLRIPGIKALITLGSPLDREPIKSKSLQRTGGATTITIPWHNIWGSLDLVCCWKPWHSGEMNTFKPTAQHRLAKQGHNLEAYIRQIPKALLVEED